MDKRKEIKVMMISAKSVITSCEVDGLLPEDIENGSSTAIGITLASTNAPIGTPYRSFKISLEIRFISFEERFMEELLCVCYNSELKNYLNIIAQEETICIDH